MEEVCTHDCFYCSFVKKEKDGTFRGVCYNKNSQYFTQTVDENGNCPLLEQFEIKKD